MKVTTKKISDTKVTLTVVLDAQDLKPYHDQAVKRLAQTVKLPGFRKGKAPADLAAKAIAPNELSAAELDIAVRTSAPAAFEQANKNPLVVPEINVTKYVPTESVEYTATAEILPEVKLGNFKDLKVKKTVAKVSPKDVDEILQNIANAYAKKQPVKRPAKLTDETVIDFSGTKDGVVFAGGSAKDFKLTLGSGQFIPGFEEGIVGHSAGDKFDLELTFPKDYHNQELAGAKTVFAVTLKAVNEVIAPKFDDALAKQCGPFKTIAELKADIKKNLVAQNEQKTTEKFKDDLVEALVKKSKLSAPEILIKDQLRFIKDDISRNAAAQGLSFEQYLKQTSQTEAEWEASIRPIAESRVKASLVLQVLSNQEKITVEDSLVDAKIAELQDVYQKSPEALKNLKDPRVRQDLKNRLTIEKTLDFLVSANS